MENFDAKANKAAQVVVEKFPKSVGVAITLIAPNIANGAFWGFLDVDTVKKYHESLSKDKNIVIRKLAGNDCLIEINPTYLIKSIQAAGTDMLGKGDLEAMKGGIVSAEVDLTKWLLSHGRTGFAGVIGIYCVNDTTAIVLDNVTYPAFRVSLGDALKIFSNCGYSVKVGGTFVSPMDAMQSGQKLWESVKLAPSKTGVFIAIRSTYPSEQYKEMYKEYKTMHPSK